MGLSTLDWIFIAAFYRLQAKWQKFGRFFPLWPEHALVVAGRIYGGDNVLCRHA